MIKLARGGIVEAIRRYDRNLRVRWSEQKKSWLLEVKARRRDMLVPPVRYERIPGTKLFKEHLLPEKDDRFISWKTGYAPVFYIKRLTWDVYEAVIQSDTFRVGTGRKFVEKLDKGWSQFCKDKDASADAAQKETTEAAFDKYKWIANRDSMATPHGAV